MIVANALTAFGYLVGGQAVREQLPGMPAWAIPVLIVMSLFNLVCALALFQWKRWGFWGFCVSGVVALVVNLSSGLGIGSSIAGFSGIILLFGVLQIGRENKGWPQLD